MLTILNLFGRSPFLPLQSHMAKVAECVHMLPSLFQAIKDKDFAKAHEIADKIADKEHEADLTKNDIRNHLPKSLFLPVDRGNLLEILSLQDSLADRAEDIAVLTTLKNLDWIPGFGEEYDRFLKKNIEAFDYANSIIKELHELLESSFGGVEAEKVRVMVEQVAVNEHEADLIQRKLLQALFQAEEELSYSTFHLWQRIFEATGALSNIAEKLAYRVRLTLELK